MQQTIKLLRDVEGGNEISPDDILASRHFRLAVEMLRIQCNENTKTIIPHIKTYTGKMSATQFYDLAYGEKCDVLLAQSLQQELKRSRTVVAVMDVRRVMGICSHWKMPVPEEVSTLADECFVTLEEASGDSIFSRGIRHTKLMDLDTSESNTAVVVGGGVAAVFGLSSFSLSNWAPISPVMTLATFKASALAKFALLHTKRSFAFALAKGASPASKVVFSKASKYSLSKAAMSAEKMRTAAQSVVAAAEKASLAAIRTTFYSIMRWQQGKHVDRRPWLLFTGSLAAGAGIWFYGDGIERAIVATPSAPSISRLGQGLENLKESSSHADLVWQKSHELLYRKSSKVS